MTSKIHSSHSSSHSNSAKPHAPAKPKSNIFKSIFGCFFSNTPKKVKAHKGAKSGNLLTKIFNIVCCKTQGSTSASDSKVTIPKKDPSVDPAAKPKNDDPSPFAPALKPPQDDLSSVSGSVSLRKDKPKEKTEVIDIEDAKTLLNMLCEVEIDKKTWTAPKGKIKLVDNEGKEILDEELEEMVAELHERFAAGADADIEFATTLHLIEEKVAERLEADGDFKGAFEMRALALSLPVHPSHPLAGDISKKVSDSGFGTYFSDLDSGVVKGGNIRGANYDITGKKVQIFDFNISHHARNKLTKTLSNIKANPGIFNSSLPKGYGPVTFQTQPFVFRGKDAKSKFSDKNTSKVQGAEVDVVTFPGKGKVFIGKTKSNVCLYKHISIQLDPGLPGHERLEAMQTMCSMLGLGPVFGLKREEDKNRLKIAQLFRAYHPKLAYKIERKAWFYEVSVEDLMNLIDELAATKGETVDWGLLPDMTEEEIYPGKKAWCVPDVAEQMRNLGAFGLMSGVGGNHSGGQSISIDKSAQIVCSILKSGMLSTQDRYQQGLFTAGASSMEDLAKGGGHTVYTRCITEGLEARRHASYSFQGNIQVLYDLDVVNRVSYGYISDQYGTKDKHTYQSRLNLLQFALHINDKGGHGNEVMVKNRIAPHYIRALVVQHKKDKDVLVSKLKAAGLVKDGKINGKPLDQFVYVASKFNEKMWEKPKKDEAT